MDANGIYREIQAMRTSRHLSIGQKLLLSAVLVGAAVSVGGLGTFASFTSTTSASSTPATGTVTIALGATGASTNRLNISASDIARGDTMQRSFDLTNAGSIDLAGVTLTTSALASRAVIGSTIALSNLSSLTAGATDHLRLTLPGAAGNTFQNITSTVTYAFTGVQRTATSK